MLFGRPVLQGVSDQDQLDKIFQLCGSPTEDNMPGWSSLPGLDEKNVSFQINKHYQRKLKEDFEPYVYLNQGVKVTCKNVATDIPFLVVLDTDSWLQNSWTSCLCWTPRED